MKALINNKTRQQQVVSRRKPALGLLVSSLAMAVVVAPTCFRMAEALGTGAPSLACSNMRPLHGLNGPKPASASQFFVTQSSLGYADADSLGAGPKEIVVEIATHSSERFFRGFMLQAYDPTSGQPIGEFRAGPDSRPISQCSSTTHRNPQNKQKVSVVWVPSTNNAATGDQRTNPFMNWMGLGANQSRKRQLMNHNNTAANHSKAPLKQVRFRATIVVSYAEFYTGFESSELSFDKFNYSQASNVPPAGHNNASSTDLLNAPSPNQ